MFSGKMYRAVRKLSVALVLVAVSVTVASAQNRERIRIPVGRAEVVNSTDEVRTVAIAEPKIADAAVGSARTVVVNGKSEGVTTLVVYGEGARFKVYDIEVYVLNGNRQVALHCTVADANDNALRELGFDHEFQVTSRTPWLDGTLSGGLFTANTSGNEDGFLTYIRTAGDLFMATAWKAMEEKGNLKTLARPTLVSRSGKKASFLAGGELPIPIASAASSGSGIQTVTIEWKEFGVRLNFTPNVMEDGSIQLEVNPEVSQLDFSNSIRLSGFEIPALITRKASTTVTLRPGEILVIGGLKHSESSRIVRRVPVLGYIPLLGFFFTDKSETKIDRDLLVVVSPEMVEASTTMPPLPTDQP